MEAGIQYFFLRGHALPIKSQLTDVAQRAIKVFITLAIAGLPAQAISQENETVQVIEPDIERREIKRAKIDKENFEIGAYGGVISIQDFDASPVVGLRAAYHITEDFFFEASYAVAEGDLTSFEELSGGSPLLSDEDRDYSYYDLSIGWNILPGEIFIGKRWAFNSAFYVIGGAGSTEFAGDSWFTVSFGAGYRLLLKDWFAWHLDVRDHMFDRDIFGLEETTHNLEFSSGLTFFF